MMGAALGSAWPGNGAMGVVVYALARVTVGMCMPADGDLTAACATAGACAVW